MVPMIQTVEAIYEQGRLRPLKPITAHEGATYLVTLLEQQTKPLRQRTMRRARGKYRGRLSSSTDFAQRKQAEKRLER